jgi:hypothetical protein
MKIVIILLMFLMASAESTGKLIPESAENPYENQVYMAKVIFSTFSMKENAYKELERLQNDKIYKKLNELAIKNNFIIQARQLGKYTILVVEPIADPKVYEEVKALLKTRYKSIYGIDDSMTKNRLPKESAENVSLPKAVFEVEKVSQSMRIVNKKVQTKEDMNTSMQKDEVKQMQAKPKQEQSIAEIAVAPKPAYIQSIENLQLKDKRSVDSGYFSWWYIFLVILLIVLFTIYKKFKSTYAEY